MGKAAVIDQLPIVFGLGEERAAAAVDLGVTKFRACVAAGTMPKPRKLDGRLIYDVDELRAAFKALPHEGDRGEVDTWADVG